MRPYFRTLRSGLLHGAIYTVGVAVGAACTAELHEAYHRQGVLWGWATCSEVARLLREFAR